MGDPQDPYPLKAPPRIGDIVHLPTGTVVTLAQMLTVAGDARIVYLGETHDNPASHRLELQVLQGLAERHPGRQALGMEMFTRSQQPALDRWVAGELDEKAFLKESRWFESWKMDFDYYRDLLNFARDRHIPVIALNAEKSLVAAVRSTAPDQLSAEERAQLPELDLTDPYQRGMVAAIFGGHSHGEMLLDGFVRAQTVWDETMAESVARYLASPAGADKHLLVVAGGNHVSNGFGIPRRAFRRLPASYVLIGGQEIELSADKQSRLMDVQHPRVPHGPLRLSGLHRLRGPAENGSPPRCDDGTGALRPGSGGQGRGARLQCRTRRPEDGRPAARHRRRSPWRRASTWSMR